VELHYGWKTLRLLAVAIAGIAPCYAGNIVVNGGFETGDFTGWTQTGNSSFDGVQCPGPGSAVAEGNCSAFFGPVGSIGGITQNLTTQIGQTYLISFDFEPDGGTPSSFSALFNGNTLYTVTNPPASAYQVFNFAAAATSTTTAIAFNFRDDPGFLFLDAVSVQAAPEPATVALVGLGIGALFFWRRRLA